MQKSPPAKKLAAKKPAAKEQANIPELLPPSGDISERMVLADVVQTAERGTSMPKDEDNFVETGPTLWVPGEVLTRDSKPWHSVE